MLTSFIGFACHSSNINSVSSIYNGNNTTTFTINLTVDVGTLDNYSYGFALIFENNSSVSPVVLSNPAFTPSLTRSGYNNLVGYTGASIGSGLGSISANYFDDRYGNRTDVLTYETDDDWFGFGSTSYSQTVVVTVQGCVDNIKIDGDFRSTGSATVQGDPNCINNYSTGISCSSSCPATPNLIFNGAAQYNSSCGICDRHNNNPPSCSCPTCGNLTSQNCSGYTACNGNEYDNSLDNNTNEFKLTHNCNCLGGSIWNDVELDLNKNFTIEAELWFGSNNLNGADGIAFVLQTDPNTTSSVSMGGSVGHGNLAPALIFEFDSFKNSSDPSQDHFQLITSLDGENDGIDNNGNNTIDEAGETIRDFVNFSTSLTLLTNNSVSLVEIEDLNWHLIKIDWEADPDNNPNTTEGRLNVFFDTNDDGDVDDTGDHLVSDFDYDLINTIFPNENGKVFWGFTSATGCKNNLHKIRNLSSLIDVEISYDFTQYYNCISYTNDQREPTITGQSGGTFSVSPSAGMSIDPNTGVITTNGATVDSYTITYSYTDALGNTCNTTFDISIIDEDPDFTYAKYSYCQTENDFSPNFIANSGGPFSVSPANGLSINSGTGEISPAASTPGIYDITYSSPLCSNTKVRQVTILASPNVDADPDFSVCYGDQITLNATGNAASYQWYDGADLIYILSSNTFPSNDYAFSSYPKTFYVVATGANGCTAMDEITVSVVQKPTINAGSNASLCKGAPFTLNGTYSGSSNHWWTTNGDGTFDDNTSLTATYTPGTNDVSNGSVTLVLHGDDGPPCGEITDSKTINFISTVGPNTVDIVPSSPTVNDDLTGDYNLYNCVEVVSNDWRLNNSSIAPLNFSFNSTGSDVFTSNSTNPAVLSIDGTSPTISQGILGNCFDFSSQGGLVSNISNTGIGAISTTNGISISVWTYSSNLVSGWRRWVELFSTDPVDGSQKSELLLRQTSTNVVEAVVWSGGSTQWPNDFIYENNQLQENVWQHWVLTYDNANTITLYKDGGDGPNELFSNTTIGQGINDISVIRINTNSSNGWYNGKLDEVMVFDRVLTPQQVEALYNGGSPDYEKIVKEETNCGESWSLYSTPYNYAGEIGSVFNSSDVTLPSLSISTQPLSGSDKCQNTTASTMNVVASGGSGTYTYQWYECQSDGSLPNALIGQTNTTFTPPTNTVGTKYYTVIITDQNPGCGTVTSDVVSQKVDEPVAVTVGPDQTVCGGSTINLSGAITGGASTGTWTSDGAGSFDNANALNPVFTPDASYASGGTITFTLTTDANGACPAVTDQTVVTITNNDPSFSYPYSEYCTNETNPQPTITGVSGGIFSSTAGLTINATTGVIDLSNSSAGTYTITYDIDDGNGCLNSSTFDVTIGISTVGFDYGGQTSFCLGSTCPSVNYTTTTGGVFSSNNSDLIVDPSTGEIDLVNSQPGNYEISYEVSSITQLGLDISSNSFDLISYANGVAMNNVGDKIAVGFPWSNSTDGFSRIYDWNGSNWNQQGNNVRYGGSDARSGECLAFDEDGDVFVSSKARWCSSHAFTGAVRVFQWNGSSWVNKGSPIFSDLSQINEDGYELKLNANGDILAIAVKKDNSNSNIKSQVKIYEWDNVTSDWIQRGATLEGEDFGDKFGNSISLNSTGDRIAIGAPHNDANNGEVKVFDWDGSSWSVVKEFNGSSNSQLGFSVSLNNNGNILAISENTFNSNEGAVTVYQENAGVWSAIGTSISGNANDKLGTEIKLNASGDRVLVSSIEGVGFVKLYKNSGNSWSLMGTVNGVNNGDQFGRSIDLNAIGDRFIVGAPFHGNGGVNNTGEVKVYGVLKSCPEPLNVTILPAEDASFDYEDICVGSIGSPSNIAISGGSYAFNPSVSDGATIDATTGQISNGVAGTTYTVEYSVNGTCPGSTTQDVLIKSLDDASFSYASCCYWTTDTDPSPTPTVTASEGTYACSDNNLSMASNGLIDLSASLAGNYTITHTSSDCPNTDTKEVLIMNGNNCNTYSYNTTADAEVDPNNSSVFILTPAANGNVGAVWCNQPLNLNYPFTISCDLSFGIKNTDGADGIAFVLQENSNVLTHNGGRLGYAVLDPTGTSPDNPGFDPSIAIEFDTHFNNSGNNIDLPAQNSTSDDHLAIQLDGDVDHSGPNALITPVNLGNIEVVDDHPVTIFWDPNPDNNLSTPEGELKVYFNNQLEATLSRDIKSDFTSSNNGMVYWGFTAATGGYNNTQVVSNINPTFWSGNYPSSLSNNTNVWQGDVNTPTETVTDPIDNTTQYTTASWFNPCNWSASFVPDYDTDVLIPQQSDYTNHPIINYNTSVFSNHSVLNFDMDRDGDIDNDDQVQGKGFAKSLKTEGDGLFFLKTTEGARLDLNDN